MDKKTAIIEAATKSFSTFGYKATSMEQISKRARVGKGTIYTFFSNKEELFDYIVNEMLKNMIQVATDSFDKSKDFFTNVHNAILTILEYHQKEELTIQLLEEAVVSGTPEVKEALKKVDKEVEAFIAHYLIMAMEKGEIEECDADIVAFLMYKLYVSLVVDWKKDHEELSKEKIASIFNQILLRGLKK